MTNIQQQAQQALDSLNESVHEALDKKRRLGQYAVIWQNNKVVRIFEDDKTLKKEG